MSLRVTVDSSSAHKPNLIPFRGLCGKGLYLPPEYVRLQEYLKKSVERENLLVNSPASGLGSFRQFNGNDMIQSEYDNNEYKPNCVNNHCQIHNPNQTLASIIDQSHDGSNVSAQNLIRPSGTGTALGGEVDGFAADVWMLGVTLLFMITGIKIQDLTLINLFLNKSNSAAQPHKWLGSIPVTVTIEIQDTDSADDLFNSNYIDKTDENKIENNDGDENTNTSSGPTNDNETDRMNMAGSSSSSMSDRNDCRRDSNYDDNRMDLDRNDENCGYHNMNQSGQCKSDNAEICSTATTSHSSTFDSRLDAIHGANSSRCSSSFTTDPSSSSSASSSEYIIQGQSQLYQHQEQREKLCESQQQQQQQPCLQRQRQRKMKLVQQQLPLRVGLPSAFDLLSKMLQIDPTQRISLSDVRNHPWLTQDP